MLTEKERSRSMARCSGAYLLSKPEVEVVDVLDVSSRSNYSTDYSVKIKQLKQVITYMYRQSSPDICTLRYALIHIENRDSKQSRDCLVNAKSIHCRGLTDTLIFRIYSIFTPLNPVARWLQIMVPHTAPHALRC